MDENFSWKEHLKLTENKVVKNIWLIYKAKPYLNKDLLLALYFSYIHSYINYANLVWGRAILTYLRKINSQKKHALRLIHNKNRLLIRTQHAFQVGITGNRKLYYANVDFQFPLKVQQYGTT